VKFAELVGTSRSTVSIWEAEINNYHPNREKYEWMKELAGQKGIDINDT
jgi:DNA-binding transcriptional regulator YiaG